MRYPGSKRRYRGVLVELIEKVRDGRDIYLEPFLGGGESFEAVAPMFGTAMGGELNEDLAMMWDAVSKGWLPPEHVSETEYAEIRKSEPSALRGFVGTGCSFGGKWFGGYARGGFSGGKPRDHQAESFRAVKRAAPAFAGREVRNCDYREWAVGSGMVVYCDPPYAGTLKYRDDFDHEVFWQTMNEWSDSGAVVVVSEQSAPEGWGPILSLSRLSSTALASQRTSTTEYVFGRNLP